MLSSEPVKVCVGLLASALANMIIGFVAAYLQSHDSHGHATDDGAHSEGHGVEGGHGAGIGRVFSQVRLRGAFVTPSHNLRDAELQRPSDASKDAEQNTSMGESHTHEKPPSSQTVAVLPGQPGAD